MNEPTLEGLELRGLAIPFGGRDGDGQHFTADTDLCLDWFREGRPLLYHHGWDASVKGSVVGRVMEHVVTDAGVWVRAQLDRHSRWLDAIKRLLAAGALGFSSGALPYFVEVDQKSGAIRRWPWVELSMTPTPSHPSAAVYAVKSVDALEHLDAIGSNIHPSVRAALLALNADRPQVAYNQIREYERRTETGEGRLLPQAAVAVGRQAESMVSTRVGGTDLRKLQRALPAPPREPCARVSRRFSRGDAMTRGPIPKAPERKARPNRRKAAAIVQIPPFSGAPDAPDELNTAGREAWHRWWNSAPWLAESDWTGVQLLAGMLDALADMGATVRAEGRTVKGSKGQPVAHPLLQNIDRLRAESLRWMADYGFTPAARRRLGIALEPKPPVRVLDKYVGRYDHLRDGNGA